MGLVFHEFCDETITDGSQKIRHEDARASSIARFLHHVRDGFHSHPQF